MARLQQSYDNLKRLAIEKYGRAHVDINFIKESYKSVINSPRVFSQIWDISSLLSVLEKRCALSPMDIEVFYNLHKKLILDENELSKHKQLIGTDRMKWISLNSYDDESGPQVPDYGLPGHRMYSSNYGVPRQRNETSGLKSKGLLSEEVLDTVCSHVGESWRSLARFLKITPEATITEIGRDPNITSNKERARLILLEYQEKMEPSQVKMKLLNALRLMEMMKLYDEVQRLFISEQ